MLKFIAGYYVVQILIVIVAIGATLWLRHRRKSLKRTHVPNGYVWTDEVFTDPTTGVMQRVWFNPETGDRFYQTVGKE